MPYIWTLELKSCGDGSISFTPFSEDGSTSPWEKPSGTKDRNIKTNQVKQLMKFSKNMGTISGFILNYRERTLKTKKEKNEVFFVHIKDFIDFAERTKKSSISREDCREMGVLIHSETKRSRYKYNIKSFVSDCVSFCLAKDHLQEEHIENMIAWLRELNTARKGLIK